MKHDALEDGPVLSSIVASQSGSQSGSLLNYRAIILQW